jgi:hypothetical protein
MTFVHRSQFFKHLFDHKERRYVTQTVTALERYRIVHANELGKLEAFMHVARMGEENIQ